MQFVGIAHHNLDGTETSLGPEYLLTDSDQLIPVTSHSLDPSAGPAGSARTTLNGPASTLVGSSSGLEIDLVWDSSVRSNPNWAAIEAAVIDAAEIYTAIITTKIVINIAVGFGEIDGSPLGSNALGESESLGYITNYSTVETALQSADSDLISSGLMSSTALTADSPPTNANFFVTSAEAKALGLVSGTSTAIDGYIGLSNSPGLLYFPANGGTIGSSQYDAEGIAAHEIGEVMGRIGLEGDTLGSYTDVYSPLDLFRYTSVGVRDLTATAGYFSTELGVGGLDGSNLYNDPQNGGDAADWASPSGGVSLASGGVADNDAYDAFGTPGVMLVVSSTDILEEAALGYTLSNTELADLSAPASPPPPPPPPPPPSPPPPPPPVRGWG